MYHLAFPENVLFIAGEILPFQKFNVEIESQRGTRMDYAGRRGQESESAVWLLRALDCFHLIAFFFF